VILEAISKAQEVNVQLIELQDEMQKRVGKPKYVFEPKAAPDDVSSAVAEFVASRDWDLVAAAKDERAELMRQVRAEVLEALSEQYPPEYLKAALDDHLKSLVRKRIVGEGVRPDGRKPEEIRPISAEVGLLPRTHGSGLFTRGETQVLTIATLGSVGDQQKLDGLEPEETRRFIHHYNFPPFSVGETRPLRGPSRRDIGHGALAERALSPLIPDEDTFPYTIRLVSEVLSSNGSTSMASTCGSRRADQIARSGYRYGSDQGGRGLQGTDGHRRDGGPLRRHGLQGSGNSGGDHCAPDGHQDRRVDLRHHGEGAGTSA